VLILKKNLNGLEYIIEDGILIITTDKQEVFLETTAIDGDSNSTRVEQHRVKFNSGKKEIKSSI
jgi:hypothetical protein